MDVLLPRDIGADAVRKSAEAPDGMIVRADDPGLCFCAWQQLGLRAGCNPDLPQRKQGAAGLR